MSSPVIGSACAGDAGPGVSNTQVRCGMRGTAAVRDDIPDVVILSQRTTQGDRVSGNEDVLENDGVRSGATHCHGLPGVLYPHTFRAQRDRKMEHLPAPRRIVVPAAGDEEIPGRAAAGERFARYFGVPVTA